MDLVVLRDGEKVDAERRHPCRAAYTGTEGADLYQGYGVYIASDQM